VGTVNVDNEAPAFGTRDYEMWARGAKAEADARREGVLPESREVADFFDAMSGNGYGPQAMVEMTAVVYGPGLPWRKRVRIAWKMLRGYRARRWYAEAGMSRSDFGLGVRWERDDTGLHIWVTFLALVVHARRARR
jgi:hypothetical protein